MCVITAHMEMSHVLKLLEYNERIHVKHMSGHLLRTLLTVVT